MTTTTAQHRRRRKLKHRKGLPSASIVYVLQCFSFFAEQSTSGNDDNNNNALNDEDDYADESGLLVRRCGCVVF
jgi:hypothetical protein